MWPWVMALAAAGDDAPSTGGMVGHFEQATLAMLAVSVGDIDTARENGLALAKDKMAPTPLRAPAKDLSKAKTLERAAPAVAQLGRACAQCHLVGRRGPRPVGMETIPDGTPVEQHITAATFAWIGLVTPLEQPYQLGLRELIPPVGWDDDEDVQQAADDFRELVEIALEPRSWDERAVDFGRMLQACAGCHTTAGVKP